MPLDNKPAHRKIIELETEVYPYQGIYPQDTRMIIRGVTPEYAEPRQEQFWDRWSE